MTIKAGRDLSKHLFTAAASGRNIDVTNLLSHELSSVPLSLANSDQSLITTDEAVLSHLLYDEYVVKELPPANDNTCVIIDGMAHVQSIGKPTTANTFG